MCNDVLKMIKKHDWRWAVDRVIFIKNGYSIMIHLIPFSIACLLLLIIPLPEDDLLRTLASELTSQLTNPTWILLPPILLTLIASVIYFLSIRLKVIQADLFTKHKNLRSLLTFFFYAGLCTAMAFFVLSTKAAPLNLHLSTLQVWFGNVWACFLLVIISFMGVGWSTPDSLATSMGIKSPNYSEAHILAKEIEIALKTIRMDCDNCTKVKIENFKALLEALQSKLEENYKIEPDWAKDDLNKPREELGNLIEQINIKFINGNQDAKEFVIACKCQNPLPNDKFITALTELGQIWDKWKCPKQKEGSNVGRKF